MENYKLTIRFDKELFELQLINQYDGSEEILKDIKYMADKKYACILPIFNDDKILTDIICKDQNNVYYNYSNITNKSETLNKFADSLIKDGYNKTKYYDNKNKEDKYGLIKLYKYNTSNNLAFGITNYKGLYVLNDSEFENIKLFNNDVYMRELSTFIDNYYLVANYNQKYDFTSFFLVDLKTKEQSEIKLKTPIANDSYISGIVGTDVYVVDKSNKKQYQVSIKNKTVKEVGNEQKNMLFYSDDKFTTVPYTRMTLKNTYFGNCVIKTQGKYNMFLKTKGIDSGYSYYYEKKDNEYYIYRSITGNKIKKYLFKTSTIEDMKSNGNYIFYQDKNEVKYYSDETGLRTLLLDSELEFNKNILYGIYEK